MLLILSDNRTLTSGRAEAMAQPLMEPLRTPRSKERCRLR